MFGRLFNGILKFILIMVVLSFVALLFSKLPLVGFFIFIAVVAFFATKLIQKIKNR